MRDDEFRRVYDYICSLPVFSDHEHHRNDEFFLEGMTLDKALNNSYTGWLGFPLDGTWEARERFLDNVRFNSYFTWFEKGLQQVHGIDEPITLETWESISKRLQKAYADDPDFHWKVLKENGYDRLVQDSYWNPGDDNGHDEIFVPTFRIDMFMYGYHQDSIGPNDIHPWERCGFSGGSLDDYVEAIRETIRKRYEKGKVVAFKCAEAYNRTVYMLPDDREEAARAFGTHPDNITEEQKLLFGNYIFNRCCELAAELDVPFQVHTGLARLSGSNPMLLEPVIARHQNTRFVLFHSGYPWIGEVGALAHNYKNVLPSITWTATICTSAAIRALEEYIDVAPSINSITWGSDCWVPEDSVGAQLAWRFICAKVISQLMADGRIRARDAEILARKLMYENGRRIYGGFSGKL